MRWPVAALLLSIGWISPVSAALPAFPYKAYVTTDGTQVRSGPGENYYPTDKLKAGQEVEVYRHDPGGWYAIRPPEGGFSWVRGRNLKLEKNQLAVVQDDRVPARVGSRFSDVRDVIQVRLHRGEVVEVLDAKRAEAAAATESSTWYKISPPSGEFRWVQGKQVDPNYSRDGLRKNEVSAAGAAEAESAPLGAAANSRGAPQSPAARASGTGRQERGDPGPAIPRCESAEQFQKELNTIDVELSAMVVEEPGAWDFGELRQRAEALLNQAETAVERGRARAVLSKIQRFDDIRQRSNTVNAMKAEIARTDRQLARLGPRPRGPATPDPTDRYDAFGELQQVSSAKAGAPQYALVDAGGKLQCYVSPAPGVNLRPYLGQQIGVTGTRGYMPEQRAAHIMARHVSVLEAGTGGTVLR